MNSAVQIRSDLQILPATPVEHITVPVVLTAHTLLRGRSDITNTLRHESFDLRYVAAWNRLPEAIDCIQADVVLVDVDAANLTYNGVQNLSGYRLVILLARQLAQRPIALVIMTNLDFAEIEELARAGVHAIVSPQISAHAFVEQVRLALQCARKRHSLLHDLTTEGASRHDDPGVR